MDELENNIFMRGPSGSEKDILNLRFEWVYLINLK